MSWHLTIDGFLQASPKIGSRRNDNAQSYNRRAEAHPNCWIVRGDEPNDMPSEEDEEGRRIADPGPPMNVHACIMGGGNDECISILPGRAIRLP
jgi:hypothetical protein